MRRSLVALFVLAALVPATALASTSYRQTARQAEVNLLHATRTLGKYSGALLNPRTGLLENNSTAICRGIGTARSRAYTAFNCTVADARVRVVVRYIPQRRNGFSLRLIKVQRLR